MKGSFRKLTHKKSVQNESFTNTYKYLQTIKSLYSSINTVTQLVFNLKNLNWSYKRNKHHCVYLLVSNKHKKIAQFRNDGK